MLATHGFVDGVINNCSNLSCKEYPVIDYQGALNRHDWPWDPFNISIFPCNGRFLTLFTCSIAKQLATHSKLASLALNPNHLANGHLQFRVLSKYLPFRTAFLSHDLPRARERS